MTTEVCLICDCCCAVVAAAKTVKQVRADAKNLYQRRAGKDICTICQPLPHNRRARADGQHAPAKEE